jgi:hypothetical protein
MNTSSTLQTNSSGYYEARLLLPGSYTVAVTFQGFKRSVRSGITLALSEQLRIDMQLEVGGTSEWITITAEAPILDTSTVSTGRAVQARIQFQGEYECRNGKPHGEHGCEDSRPRVYSA